MYKIRFILTCWCCACFFHGTSSAVASEPFISTGSSAYPIYCLFSLRQTPAMFHGALTNTNATLTIQEGYDLFQAVLTAAGCKVTYLSDYQPDFYFSSQNSTSPTYTKYDAGDFLLIELPNYSVNFQPSSANEVTYALVNKLIPIITIRRQQDSDLYDVFLHAQITGFQVPWLASQGYTHSISLAQYPAGSTGAYESAIVARISNLSPVALSNSYQLVYSGVFKKSSSGFTVASAVNYSLPFKTRENSVIVDFCQTVNKYWDGDTGTSYYKITNTPVWNTPLSGAPAFYNNLQLQTADGIFQQGTTQFSNIMSLDTDNGGMTDYHEWYQTQHDLLDPEDDDTNTDTPPIPDEDIPEGESVVDIGRDTVNRYDQYWQEQVGDTNDLEPIQPSNPNLPQDVSPEDVDFSSLVTDVETTLDSSFEQSQFKSKFDDVFKPLSSSDQKLTWSFNPSVNNSLVTFPLETITIDPQAVVNDSNFGSFFVLFRGCLVLFEFLVFVYGMYKMALSNISGTSNNTDDET